MYRLLRAEHQVRERRRQARRPATIKPELMATGANQVWSWDITKLRGPHKWTWFQLYVILDVDRKSVVEGKSVSVRVDLGGRRIIKKKKQNKHKINTNTK